MNFPKPTSPGNPFARSAALDATAFYGRQREIQDVTHKLLSQHYSCPVVGETQMGKTSFLRYFSDMNISLKKNLGLQDILFVYFDSSPYYNRTEGDRISVQFWWDMHHALQLLVHQDRVGHNGHAQQYPPLLKSEEDPIEVALEMKDNLEKILREQKEQKKRVVFALDNLEGIASLPVRDSIWLRSLDRFCSYIATSRYPLRLLYHPERKYSPFWNSFLPESVYLGLFAEGEVNDFIYQGKTLTHFWHEQDIAFIKEKAGRHPAFLRIICELVYRKRAELRNQQAFRALNKGEIEMLEVNFFREASAICNQLWHGLADPELMGISRLIGYQRETTTLSPHQQALLEVVQQDDTRDSRRLLELEQRGFVECKGGKWYVFAEIMRQFVLNLSLVSGYMPVSTGSSKIIDANSTGVDSGAADVQGANSVDATIQISPSESEMTTNTQADMQASSLSQTKAEPAFTYLEGEVYHYLLSHTGEVCDKNDIKQAIWKKKLPTDSTLQKLIERIRRKIEPDPDNPRYLIAVRGQGYILRQQSV